jgi:hypothetical protein
MPIGSVFFDGGDGDGTSRRKRSHWWRRVFLARRERIIDEKGVEVKIIVFSDCDKTSLGGGGLTGPHVDGAFCFWNG